MKLKKNECFVSITLQESDWLNVLFPAIIAVEHGLYLKPDEAIDSIIEVCNQIPTTDQVYWDEDEKRFIFVKR